MRRRTKSGTSGQAANQNLEPMSREELEAEYGVGNVLDTKELAREYIVTGYIAPFLVVTRKCDGRTGTLMCQNAPRYYFGWKPDEPP